MHMLLLAAGSSGAPSDADYPLWLTEIEDGLLFERQACALARLNPEKFVFMFRREDVEAYFLNDICAQLVSNAKVLSITHETAGAACTALLASGEIDSEDELIVANVNDQIDVDFGEVVEHFRLRGADAGVLTFPSLHPRYSFVRSDPFGWVLEAAEKRPISRHANAGFFWFRRAGDFFDAIRAMILKDDHVKGRFYIAPALNQLILRQKRVASIELPKDLYHSLKSAREVGALGDQLAESA